MAKAEGAEVRGDIEPKLAQKIAARIETDIIRLGWPVGRNLGNEAEFAKRYGAGRWVIREAINIAIQDGLIQVRRGRSGGLVVAAPAEDTVISTLQNYLSVAQISTPFMLEASGLIEKLALHLASENLALADLERLREFCATGVATDDPLAKRVFREILMITGNISVYVFAMALLNTLEARLHSQALGERKMETLARDLRAIRGGQIEAVGARDELAIVQLEDQYLRLLKKSLVAAPELKTDSKSVKARADVATAGTRKRSEFITQELMALISAAGWVDGHLLGTEPDLMTRYGVSRETFREAIRPLERHGIVQMKRGRGAHGGLRVARANPYATIKSVVLYLKYSRFSLQAAYAVQLALDQAAVAKVAQLPVKVRAEIGQRLIELANRPLRQTMRDVETYITEFYLYLADHSGNPIYALFIRVLADMVALETEDAELVVPAASIANISTAARQIATFCQQGDHVAARRAMFDLRAGAMRLLPRERPVEDILAREIEEG